MNDAAASLSDVKTISKRLAKRALDMGENRLQLLLLEMEEERERLLLALLLGFGAAACGLLAGVAFTVVVLLLSWNSSPLMAMTVLTVFYAVLAAIFTWRMVQMRRDWKAFTGSLSQLREDCSCLAEFLH